MADMTQISAMARCILSDFRQISFSRDSEHPLEYFERVKSIMTVVSQIKEVDPDHMEQFMLQVSQIISKATSKMQNENGILDAENFQKILTCQDSKELPKAHESREYWEEELSNTCWMFLQKLDHLFRQSMACIGRQDEKQNRDQNHAFDDQTLQLFVKELSEFGKQIQKIKLGEAQNIKEQSPKSKMHCESQGCKKHANSQSKSSCRSLLTEKLKNIATIDNDEENGVFCVQNKIVIKGNWVLREMKGHQNEKGSQPRQILSCQEESYQANIRSMGLPIINRKPQKTELSVRKGILEQMIPFTQSKKEKKVHRHESGCARCEIY